MLSDLEWQALWLSIKVALAATALNLPTGFAVAWALTRSAIPWKPFWRSVTLLPLVVPPVVMGYLLLLMFSPNHSLGALLSQVGLVIAFNWKGAVLASWITSFPLMIRSMVVAIERHDWRLEEAAICLGSSPLKTFGRITLPLLKSGLIGGSVLAFSRAFGEFGATVTLCASIPGETQTLPLAIYNAVQQPDGDAAALRLTLICAAVSVVAVAASEWVSGRKDR